jgi:hypothetical protein
MENNSSNKEQPSEQRNAEGSENQQQQQSDRQYLEKQQQAESDTFEKHEGSDALVGDVDPTTRIQTSQEEQNGDAQSQSEASKISGEQL